MKIISALALCMVALSASAEGIREGTMQVKPYVDVQTIQSINEAFDQTYTAFGATFAWKHIELDIAHGAKSIHCLRCKWEDGAQNGTLLGVRVYPSLLQRTRPYLSYQHISDLFRGPPFDRNENEPTIDYASVGVTLDYFDRVEFDLSYGKGALDCGYLSNGKPCKWDDSFQVRFRVFPMKTYTFNTLHR